MKNGSSASTTVRVNSIYGYDERVSLKVQSVPSYMDVSLSRTAGTPSFSSILTVRADGDSPFVTDWISVKAVGEDGKSRSRSIEVTGLSVTLTEHFILAIH